MSGIGRVVLVLAVGGAGFGGGLLAQALRPAPAPARLPARRVEAPVVQVDRVARERIDALAQRVDRGFEALDRRLERAAGDARPAPRTEPPRGNDDKPDAARVETRGPVITLVDEFRTEPYTHRRSQQFFNHLARRHAAIGPAIAQLRKAIARDPTNPNLHAALGTALSAKTAFETPPGPEQGTVWAEAEKSFQKAIELDPNQWEARYSLAFGDSMAPEFVGLRPRAIKRFEDLVEIQERQPPAEDHVLAYVRLGTLYKDAGNTEKARAVWQRGLERHPENEALTQALALLGKGDEQR